MSRPSRSILITFLALLGVFVIFKLSLHVIVKYGVQTLGSRATHTEVKLRVANVSLLSGTGDLRWLTVGNPAGFDTERAFDLSQITVKIDVPSLFTDTVVIREIVIDVPELTYEIREETSNIKAILDNIRMYVREPRGGEETPREDRGEDKRLRIDNVIIRDGKVTLSAPELRGSRAVVPLPNIYLGDIGSGGGGVLPEEAMEQILAEVNRGIGRALSDPTTAPGAAFKKAAYKIKGLFD